MSLDKYLDEAERYNDLIIRKTSHLAIINARKETKKLIAALRLAVAQRDEYAWQYDDDAFDDGGKAKDDAALLEALNG